MSASPSICYRFGIETSNRGPGCEPVTTNQITTVAMGANGPSVRQDRVFNTSKGFASVDTSSQFDPNIGTYNDRALKTWDPDPNLSGGYDYTGDTSSYFDQNSVKNLSREVGKTTDVTSDSPENLKFKNVEQQEASASSKPPAPPSTRPYIWKKAS